MLSATHWNQLIYNRIAEGLWGAFKMGTRCGLGLYSECPIINAFPTFRRVFRTSRVWKFGTRSFRREDDLSVWAAAGIEGQLLFWFHARDEWRWEWAATAAGLKHWYGQSERHNYPIDLPFFHMVYFSKRKITVKKCRPCLACTATPPPLPSTVSTSTALLPYSRPGLRIITNPNDQQQPQGPTIYSHAFFPSISLF